MTATTALTPDQWRAVNEAVGWDDRKRLADVFQDHCRFPVETLSEEFYEAILACAREGAAWVALNELTED